MACEPPLAAHGLVLGALALVHSDIPRLAFGLSWVATVATAVAVYRLLAGRGAAFGGLLAAGLLVSSATTFAVFPLETPLLAACQAWALVFVSERRWLALGAALGVGFLVRADNALLALVLLAWALRDGERLKTAHARSPSRSPCRCRGSRSRGRITAGPCRTRRT